MKKKRILAMILAVASCLSLAVGASAASTTTRKATDFKDYDAKAWYAEAVSAAVDNGLLYGKSSTIIDPNGDMTRAEMAAIINRSFGCYKTADISQYKDVAKSKWYYKDVALAVQMGTYNGRSSSSMAPDSPITRQEAMTVVARALELDYDSYSKTDLSKFADRDKISTWALPYVRAMVGAGYIHGRTRGLEPLDNITRAEFAQIFHNIIGSYITVKGSYDKDIKGSVLIRTDDVTLKDMTVDGDLIVGCGAADGKIALDNVTVKGRLLVWGGGTAAVYCNNGTNMPAVVVARVDDAVKVIYDRDSTLAVIDTIKTRITERAKQNKETEIIFYDVSGLREAQKDLNSIVENNLLAVTAPAHLYALVGETSVKAEFINNSKNDTYKVEIRRNKDNALIADAFELAAGKSISALTLLEAAEFGNTDCTVTISAYRDGKQIGSMQMELLLHTAYLWPKEVQYCDVEQTVYGFDLDHANQILDEAGYVDTDGDGIREKNGAKLSAAFLYQTGTASDDNMVVYICDQASKIGIELTPQSAQMMDWYAMIQSGDYGLTIFKTQGGYPFIGNFPFASAMSKSRFRSRAMRYGTDEQIPPTYFSLVLLSSCLYERKTAVCKNRAAPGAAMTGKGYNGTPVQPQPCLTAGSRNGGSSERSSEG